MGFGHRVYRVTDPRSDVVKAVVESLGRDLGRLRFAEHIEQAALAVLAKRKPTRSLQTNLEFYTALLLEALRVVALYLMGSSSISVQAFAAFAGQDAGLATLLALRAWALRCRHGTGQQLLIQ
jgi:hypothetical protein